MKYLIFLFIILPFLFSIPSSKFLNDPPFLSDDKMDFTSFATYFSSYNLTKGEIRAIFRFCDKNNEDKISLSNWEDFRKFFLLPFEKDCLCEGDKSPVSSGECEKQCIKKSGYFKFISESDLEKIRPSSLLNRPYLNLHDYVFLRRASYAWRECSVDNKLNKKGMECALTIFVPQKRRFLPVQHQVFRVAVRLFKGRESLFLNFFQFLDIAISYFFFNEFELPYNTEYLPKKLVVNALEDQVLPSFFNLATINDIYSAFDPEVELSFSDFATLAHFLKLYRKAKKSKHFGVEVFKKFLKNKEFEAIQKEQIDNILLTDQQNFGLYENTSTEGEKDEKDFYIRFKRSKDVDDSSFSNDAKKKDVYEVLFNMLDEDGKKNLKFSRIILFVKLAWQFAFFDSDHDGYIDANDIREGIKHYIPVLQMTTEEQKQLHSLLEWIEIYSINLKQFLSYFTFDSFFERFLLPDSKNLVTRKNLEKVFSLVNLQISNSTVVQSSQKGLLSSLNTFNYQKAFKEALRDEISVVRTMRIVKADGEEKKNNEEKSSKEYFKKQSRTFRSWKTIQRSNAPSPYGSGTD